MPAYPEASKEFYVADFSQCLNDFTSQHIISESKKLEELTGTQIVVTLVPTTEKEKKENYAQQLAYKWKLADDNKNQWALLLFKTDSSYGTEGADGLPERSYVHLELGKGIEDIVTVGDSGEILDKYAGAIRSDKNNYDEVAYDVFNAIGREIYQFNGLEIPKSLTYSYEEISKDSDKIDQIESNQIQADLVQAESTIVDNPEPLHIQIGKAFLISLCLLVSLMIVLFIAYWGCIACLYIIYFVKKSIKKDANIID